MTSISITDFLELFVNEKKASYSTMSDKALFITLFKKYYNSLSSDHKKNFKKIHWKNDKLPTQIRLDLTSGNDPINPVADNELCETDEKEVFKFNNLSFIAFLTGIFSNFYKKEFDAPITGIKEFDDITRSKKYSSVEQFFHAMKTVVAYNVIVEPSKKEMCVNTFSLIFSTCCPMTQKEIGRNIPDFDVWGKYWDNVSLSIMTIGIYAAASDNEFFRNSIMSYNEYFFVEGSANCKVWAVGIRFDDEKIKNPVNWQGRNLLGCVYTNMANIYGKYNISILIPQVLELMKSDTKISSELIFTQKIFSEFKDFTTDGIKEQMKE